MAENTIGAAWVAIRPDVSGFESALTSGISGPLANVNKGALVVIGSIVGLGAIALKLGSQFSSSLTMIEGRMNITAAAGNAIGAAFLSTAGKATFSAVAIAQAFAPVAGQLEQVNKGALSASQSLAFMNTAMKLAEATGQPLATVTATLAGILQTFGLNLTMASSASDVLYNASNALGVPIDSLATSLDRARTNAGSAAPSLSDLSTLLLDLAENGETGRGAMSILGTALTGIEAPTAKVLEYQNKLNLSFLTANGQLKPLRTIIGDLNPLISGMGNAQATATLKALGFGSASSKLVGIIDGGLPAWDKANAAVDKSGTVATGASKNTNTLAGAWDKFSSTVTDMLTTAGTPLNTFLKNVVNWLTAHLQPAVNWIINNWPIWSKILIPLVAAWSTWNAIAISGRLVTMLQSVGASMGVIAGSSGAVEAGIAPLLALGVASFAGLIELLNYINPIGPKPLLPGVNPRTGHFGGSGAANFGTQFGRTSSQAPGGASGGLGFAGHPMVVGEFGPELFTPSGSGTVTSTAALRSASGSGAINQVLNFYGTQNVGEVQQMIQRNNRQLVVALQSK